VFNRFDDLEKGFKGGNVMLSLTVEEEVEDETVLYIYMIIVELRTPATPVGVGGGKERGGCHLNLRT